LGHAIAHYGGFEGRGFRVACVFDSNPQKIGRHLGRFEICAMSALHQKVQEQDIQIAIIAVPVGAAQGVANELVAAGIKAILNYAPITITVPPGVRVQYIDPVTHLQHMTYYL
jgi:redox-sensing transcriptional repressor